MTAVQRPYQELIKYLENELNVMMLETDIHDIEAIVMSNHKQQTKDAYNQGYRDGIEDWGDIWVTNQNVEKTNRAEYYYNKTFNK